jgi:glucose-6-phosphate 1-dehydrogenase
VKVLRSIRRFSEAERHDYSVRGQYGPGTLDGKAVPGYREEPDVAPDSPTPTYAALRLMVDNWRWQGVPFFLRSAKRMPRRVSEIAIQFRKPPHQLFPQMAGRIEPNVLAIMVSVDMDFNYAEAFGSDTHEAYETLLLDCMRGDATLFTRSDEVEEAWGIVDPVIEYWAEKQPSHFPNYAAGSWGPDVAAELLEKDGAVWREP